MDELQNQFELIADGLAEKGYGIAENFLSKEEVAAIRGLKVLQSDIETLQKAGIGKENKQINEAVRGDHIQWIDAATAPMELKIVLEKIESLRTYLNRTLFLGLKDFEVHIARYPAGAGYKRHLDQFKKDDHRKISVVCYLNEGWKAEDGGQLKMYFPDHSLEVLPEGGKLICFKSDLIEHEVIPAGRERASLTGWMLDQYSDLRHL